MPPRNLGSGTTNVPPGGSVTEAMLAKPSVGTPELFDNAITLAKMADASVGTAELVNAAVTLGKMANNSVDGNKIGPLSVQLANMAAGSVDSSKIVDDSIVNADINSAAAIVSSKLAGYGAYPLANVAVTAVATISITSIPQTYKHLLIIVTEMRSNQAAGTDLLQIKWNGIVANYVWTIGVQGSVYSQQSSAGTLGYGVVGDVPGTTAVFTNIATTYEIIMGDYSNTSGGKNSVSKGFSSGASGGGGPVFESGATLNLNAAGITRIDFSLLSGANFVATVGGQISIYGLE